MARTVGVTDSNINKYDIHRTEGLPSAYMLQWRAWRTANRVRSGQDTPAANICGATGRANIVRAAQPHAISTIARRAARERPTKDGIAEMKDRSVRWPIGVADTT